MIKINEIAEVNFQLPESIDDLTKWDMFFSARIPLYKKLLKNVKSWDEATEEEKRIFRRAQEEVENLIDIHAVMGELYKNLPEDKGGDRRSENFKADTNVAFETPKEAFRNQIGLSEKKAQRFATIANNKEIVEEVKAEAREKNELPTETEILKRIELAKKEERERIKTEQEEEVKDLKEKCDYLEYQLEEEQKKEPKVIEKIVEVVPDDYEEWKKKAKQSAKEASAWKKDYENQQIKTGEVQRKLLEKEDEVKKLQEQTVRSQLKNDFESGAIYFIAQCGGFIRDVAGYVWIADKLSELSEKDRIGYIKAAKTVRDWADVLLMNIERDREYGEPELRKLIEESAIKEPDIS